MFIFCGKTCKKYLKMTQFSKVLSRLIISFVNYDREDNLPHDQIRCHVTEEKINTVLITQATKKNIFATVKIGILTLL
jgi:hypothetical protein